MSTSIRDIVLRARAAQNLSQGEMADAMGVSRVSVSNWETGKAEPSIASLQSWQNHSTPWVAQMAADILNAMFPAREMARIGG